MCVNNVDIAVSGGGLYDKSLCFYNLQNITASTIHFMNKQQVHSKSVTKIMFLEDKKMVVTCGSDCKVKMW